MEIWAIANQKGGVGKTTTVINMAGLLAISGRKTLVVDLDPQGSLTTYLGFDPERIEVSAYQLFVSEKNIAWDAVKKTGISNLDILPASTALATLDRQLGAQMGKGLVLKKFLSRISTIYSHVLIDCPPVLGISLVNAIAACNRLLLPVQTEYLALKGLERMVSTLGMIQRSRAEKIPFTVIPTMFDQRTRASHETLSQLHDDYAEHIWQGGVIPIDTHFRDASRLGVPLTLWNARSRGAQAYRDLLTSLLRVTRSPAPGKAGEVSPTVRKEVKPDVA